MNKRMITVNISIILSMLLLLPNISQAFEFEIKPVNPIMTIPFILILLAIAFIPLINLHFWEKFYPVISIILGLIAVYYYIAVIKNPLRMAATGLEYFGFISLIGSLFVVSGGININIKKMAPHCLTFFCWALDRYWQIL